MTSGDSAESRALASAKLGGVAIENADLRAVVGKHVRAGITDAARAAGDQRHLSINAEKLGYSHVCREV